MRVGPNIPGFEQQRCFITDGDSKKLVETMLCVLESMSETAYNELEDFDADVFEQLTQLEADWEEKQTASSALSNEGGEERDSKKKNPYTRLTDRLLGHLRQLPVIAQPGRCKTEELL